VSATEPRIYEPAHYIGHTYPTLLDNAAAQWLWQRLFCPRGWHLWDESHSGSSHGLSCDACGAWFGWRVED